MITVTCQHTGIEFEAKSKAAKNHPAISDLLTEAHKRGAHQQVKDLLVELRAECVTDLAEIEALAQVVIDGRRAELQAARDLYRARRAEWNSPEARQARRENYQDEEDADFNSPVLHTDLDRASYE